MATGMYDDPDTLTAKRKSLAEYRRKRQLEGKQADSQNKKQRS